MANRPDLGRLRASRHVLANRTALCPTPDVAWQAAAPWTGPSHVPRSRVHRMELGEIRELLAAAQGYAVLGRDRKRVGIFIQLPDGDGEQIAIRRDGVLVWRRALLPLATVASVLPERRVI